MRIVVTTGGTGGHIFPALALIEEIKKQNPQAHVLFVGGKYGMEKDLCQKAQVPFIGLNVKGFIGRGFKSIEAFFLLTIAFFQARKILKENNIDIVVGFGGYASAPSILAAKSLNKKIFMAEQNAFPGSVSRFFARFAKKIMLSLPVKESIFPKKIQEKCIITGNPVRQEISQNAEKEIIEKKNENSIVNVLVLGGSLGAQSINSLIISMIDELHEKNIELVHQCGKNDYPRVLEAFKKSGYPPANAYAFIDNMPQAYENADIIIARAGASTIAEVACMGKACIFIPFPFASHDHQYHNAKILEEKNACLLIEEREVYRNKEVKNKELLLEKILFLAENPKERYTLASNIHTFAKANAAAEMYKIIVENN